MPSYRAQTDKGDIHFHGDLGEHCADCSDVAGWLCDFPIGGDLTCDRRLCERHGRVVGDNAHYCLTHYRQWRAMNPGEPDYQMTHLRRGTLPAMAQVALGFLKDAFDRRDQGHRGEGITPFLRNSAIPLGADGVRIGQGDVPDAPFESLAGGLRWCLEHDLIEVCWRQPPGRDPQPWFAMTRSGLAVMEGETVERG